MPELTDKVDLKVRIKIRKDTASNWANTNPILLDGEIGIEVDESITDIKEIGKNLKIKVGDNNTAWNDLEYSLDTVALNRALDALNNEVVKLNPTVDSQIISNNIIVGGNLQINGVTTVEGALVANSGTTAKTLTVQETLTTNENSTTTLNGNTTITNAEITNLNTGSASTINGVQIASVDDITNTIAGLDKEDTAVAGSYVSAVTETNGIINISRATITSGTTDGTINVGGADVKVKNIDNVIKNTGSQTITGDLTVKKEGESTGDLVVQGNLTVQGTTTTKNTESLIVKDNMIITNGDNAELSNLSGFAIKTGVWLDPTNKTEVPAGTAGAIAEAYAIALDPTDKGGSVNLGLGSLSTDNEFTFDSDGGKPVATRASSDQFGAGEIIVWNSDDKYDLVGSDRTLTDLDTSIADAKKAGTDAQEDLSGFKTTVSNTYSTKEELTTSTSGTLKIKYPTAAGSSESTEVIYTPSTNATVEIPVIAGPTGPQGDSGLPGATGPTGPAGPTRTLTIQLPTSTGFINNVFDSSADKVIIVKIDDGVLE